MAERRPNIPFWPYENGTTTSKFSSGKKPVEFNGKRYWFNMYDNGPQEGNKPRFTLYWKEAAPLNQTPDSNPSFFADNNDIPF